MSRLSSKLRLRRPAKHEAPRDDDSGIKLIVAYKLTKAVAEGLLAVALFFLAEGASEEVRRFAVVLRHHVTAAWCVEVLNRLAAESDRHHVRIVAIASLADGAFSFVEGWSLHRRLWWARWLIVVATGSLVPFEIAALVRHWSPVRIGILVLNAAIVVYLVYYRAPFNARHAEA